MAVAMETAAWRGSELPVKTKNHPAAWGADAQKLMQMMMGQLHSSEPPPTHQLSTLDLFRHSDPPCSQLASSSSAEFLGLEPEEPLPSGWEKCLDLKSGKLYYVQRSAGVSTFNDPRNQQQTNQLSPREFLGSKQSETLSLKASSSSSESPRKQSSALDLLQKPRWSLQLDSLDVTLATSCEEQEREEDSNVELDLNLAAGGSSPSPSPRRQTVCTMAMIKSALRRTETQSVSSPNAVGKRKLQHKLSTVSSSFSSLTSTRSDPVDSYVAPSPSTSSSSSTSSKSRRAPPAEQPSSTSTEIRDDDSNVALVMGACTRCLMYVMLKKVDPKCPRCESEVPVDFSGPPCKRQMVGFQRR